MNLQLINKLMIEFELDEVQLLTLIASGAAEMSTIAGTLGEELECKWFRDLSDRARDLYNSDLEFY